MRIRQLFIAALLLLTGMAPAQEMPAIPVDKDVRIGKLDNGLTYYIRYNNYPEHVANFYIAQRVGSVNENEDQRGLAHLLEHMAFNGTEHFKDNSLQAYLQSIGVEYGRNLNAYTSTDQTVYFFTDVPTTRQSALDSCMLILKDWSNGITLDSKAIDEERDIVHNEYRMRIVGTQKILEQVLPDLYPGSKYGQRFPIGLMEVIDGCDPETLRDYYRKWYRPDNQGIIIVGDIDVDRTEQQIKDLFGDIKVPADAAKVELEDVPDNKEAIYVVGKDKEQQVPMLMVFMKHDAIPDAGKTSMEYLMMDFAKDVIEKMLATRLTEKSQEADSPLLQAQASDGNYLVARTKDAMTLVVIPKDGQELKGLAAGLRELKRVREHGFTATEYERAKAEYMSHLESDYNNREKLPNNKYCQQYVDNFIANEPIPGIGEKYQLMQQLTTMLNVDVINMIVKELISESDENLVVLAMQPDKEGVTFLTVDDLKNTVAEVRAEQVEAYVDDVKQEPLMAKMPKKGKIVKEESNKALGFKKLTLSNGITVMMKKTDFNADEILMRAEAPGGASVFPASEAVNVQALQFLLPVSGLGTFSNTELQKALAGKKCSTFMKIDDSSHSLTGTTTPKDLETLMQLTYLSFTDLAKDEKAAETMRQTILLSLKNISSNADFVFMDSVASATYKNNPLFRIPTAEGIESANYDHIMDMAKTLYGNAGNFKFTFVGNYDEAQLRGFIEQYIASLPTKGAKLQAKEVRTFADGDIKVKFTKEMQNPQAQASEIWRSDAVPYTLYNEVYVDAAARLLEITYNREIRETLSAAYHAGAESEFDADGPSTFLIITGSGKLNPEKADIAIPHFMSGMQQTIAQPNEEDLQQVKQIMLKHADEASKTNSRWLSVLAVYDKRGVDIETDYKKTVEGITPASISAFLKDTILKSGHHIQVVMMPEAAK